MHKGLRKPQAYPWIRRGFSQILYAQEIGADRVKNRSIYYINTLFLSLQINRINTFAFISTIHITDANQPRCLLRRLN